MFSDNLRYFRKLKQFTQRQLADMVGVSAAFISLLEQGKSGVSDETMQKIANALDITVHQLTSAPIKSYATELCNVLATLTKQRKISWKVIEKSIISDIFYGCSFDAIAGFYCDKAIKETVVVLKIEKENENTGKLEYGYCLAKTVSLQSFKDGMDVVSFPIDELLTVFNSQLRLPEEYSAIINLYETVQNSIDEDPVYSVLQDFKTILNFDDSEQDKE